MKSRFALLLLFLSIGCRRTLPYHVRVVDDSGKPVASAVVSLSRPEERQVLRTDARGCFSTTLREIHSPYDLVAQKNGFYRAHSLVWLQDRGAVVTLGCQHGGRRSTVTAGIPSGCS